jgi:hypothetical protein
MDLMANRSVNQAWQALVKAQESLEWWENTDYNGDPDRVLSTTTP